MPESRFARTTTVPVNRTRAELLDLLANYGVRNDVGIATAGGRAVCQFLVDNRHIRITLPLPKPDHFATTSTGRARSDQSAQQAYDQAERQVWRALLLIVKSALEAMSYGVLSIDQAFMPWLVLPDHQTVGDHIVPWVEHAYQTHDIPPLLGFGSQPRLLAERNSVHESN